MDIYLPIAGLSVNALVIVGLGGLVGLLTGMVGVGGGFLITPILIFYGIPPAVAVACTGSTRPHASSAEVTAATSSACGESTAIASGEHGSNVVSTSWLVAQADRASAAAR